MNKEQQQQLRKPFPKEHIQSLPPRNGVALDYVSHAWVTDRLLEVDPEWTWKPLALDADGLPKFDEQGGLWIELTVCGVTRLGYGEPQGRDNFDAKKGCVGNAIRNSAMRFGIALDLWAKEAPAPQTAPQAKASAPAPAKKNAAVAEYINNVINAITKAETEGDLENAAQQIGAIKSKLTEQDVDQLRSMWTEKKIALTTPAKVTSDE